MFIVFDGIDGAGKTTQINLVEEWLRENEINLLLIREPGGCEKAEKIRSILLKNSFLPLSQLLLFSAARFEMMNKIKDEKRLILCDRFIDSTYAYQGLFVDKDIIDFIVKNTVLRYPDYVFLFLNKYKTTNDDYLEDMAESSHDVLINNFKSQVKKNYFLVPTGSIEEQYEYIKEKLKKILNL